MKQTLLNFMSDSFDEPSKVMIKASRDDLYGFQVNNPQYSELIKCMLRSLPGVLTDFVKINEEMLAKKTGLTAEKVMEQLKKLETYNFLSYSPRNDKPQVLFLSEFVDTKHFGLSKENYYNRKKDAEARVKAVIDFVNSGSGRFRPPVFCALEDLRSWESPALIPKNILSFSRLT